MTFWCSEEVLNSITPLINQKRLVFVLFVMSSRQERFLILEKDGHTRIVSNATTYIKKGLLVVADVIQRHESISVEFKKAGDQMMHSNFAAL